MSATKDPARPLLLPVLSRVLRAIPAGTRGKTRLARWLAPTAARAGPALIRNRNGDKLEVLNLLEPVGLYLWMDGVYEPETLHFLRSHVTTDSVFVDVGANIGAFAIPLARCAKRVIAIEPSPQVLPYLARNVELNRLSNVEIAACAAGLPGCDLLPLYVPPESHFGMASSAPQFDVAPTAVRARPLDAILRECEVERVSVLKIDTEGYEAHVLLGAEELLRGPTPPPVVFEFCDWAEERAFPGRKGWAQRILMEAGYTLWTIQDYLRGGAPLREAISDGTHSIVGIPTRASAL